MEGETAYQTSHKIDSGGGGVGLGAIGATGQQVGNANLDGPSYGGNGGSGGGNGGIPDGGLFGGGGGGAVRITWNGKTFPSLSG